ncbi:CHAT domain-containing protein [Streptomyces sp. TRM49041]|uniref:CHAT domain-containing protein n=1 Tax=Streptomyces sp. TRM49041 TaxID=2603216 RepID=UPI0037DA113B
MPCCSHTAGEPRLRALPLDITFEDTARQAVRLVTAARQAFTADLGLAARLQAQRTADEVLRWLWDRVAQPVLAELGLFPAPQEPTPEVPHIWWCLTGPMSLLPVPAAGDRTGDAPTAADGRQEGPPVRRSVLEYAVSSLAPTVGALVHARTRVSPVPVPHPGPSAPGRGPLLVAVPDAGQAPAPEAAGSLDQAEAEARALTTLLPGALPLIGPDATRDRVVEEIRRRGIAHFACHGHNHPNDPSQSRMMLADGPLTVLDVARLQLPHATLAYLSACHTAAPGDWLPDESIHLGASLHLAGYRHVIGTLWPVDDQPARQLAEHFYAALIPRDGRGPEPDRAAHALRQAMLRLRRTTPSLVWAAYVHVGAV